MMKLPPGLWSREETISFYEREGPMSVLPSVDCDTASYARALLNERSLENRDSCDPLGMYLGFGDTISPVFGVGLWR